MSFPNTNNLNLRPKSRSIPTAGLLAYYPFNGNANDESGNTNNGIVNGAVLNPDRKGVPNSAYKFTTADNISVPDNSALNLSGDYTISLWVYPVSSVFSGTIISKDLGGAGWTVRTNGFLTSFDFLINQITRATIPLAIQLNTWYHIAVRRQANDLRMIINNDPLLEVTSATAPPINANSSPLLINQTTPFVRRGDQLIDDVRIYDNFVSDQALGLLYNE